MTNATPPAPTIIPPVAKVADADLIPRNTRND